MCKLRLRNQVECVVGDAVAAAASSCSSAPDAVAALNYVNALKHFDEAKSLLRKTMPVARRALGEGNRLTLKLRWIYAQSLYKDDGATLDDLREALTTLEDTERIARRVLGGAHPTTTGIEISMRKARAALRARETPPAGDTVGED